MDKLEKNDVLLIFTYAPAGLGHMRVMNALIDGLPAHINFAILGTKDTRIRYWHRLMSISPRIRNLIEWLQEGRFRFWLYSLYIWLLRLNGRLLFNQIKAVVTTQRFEKKVVVIVSTHFGLAHQIAAIKEKLETDLNVKLFLIDQITDATSMEILYIPGADLIFVPSAKVKTDLIRYAKSRGLRQAEIYVSPYPVSPNLNRTLSDREFDLKQKQYTLSSDNKIKIAIPISGAAVGLKYYDELTYILGSSLDRCEIHIVVKDSLFTKNFIRKMARRHWVKIIKDQSDKNVVASYDLLYQEEIIGLEIVKPSEQSFKTLFSREKRGGAILLFTEPIGKQEHDNLDFLLDHQLIPSDSDQLKLESLALGNFLNPPADYDNLQQSARRWRGIRLTNDPSKDSRIITWCLKMGIFLCMGLDKNTDSEVSPHGVELFWQKVEDVI